MVFDREQMRRVYDFAYHQAENGYAWRKAPPGLDPDEVFATGRARAEAGETER